MLVDQTQPPVLYGDYSDSLVQIVVPDQLAFTDTEVQWEGLPSRSLAGLFFTLPRYKDYESLNFSCHLSV